MLTVVCFAVGGWLWWSERDVPLLVVDAPLLQLGEIPRSKSRTLEISVTNTSSHPLRLAGIDGESC